ncbi:hypothetical protein [Falsirhodobacter deserti]|uniref:hypothetical protein n=1 Tax=Falsirhodobacter deserti TaxID=1365611 RepID=UPI000FE443CD|nr:hypothetical protein [Falsirhodobacter deserti]
MQLAKMFPDGFFDAGFSVVRDPGGRVRSAFHYHQTKRKKILAEETFESWLPRIKKFANPDHARFDDHFRPQTSFVPEWCDVFRLEDGLDALVPWLDEWADETHPADIGRTLVGKNQPAPIAPEIYDFVQDYYAEDYERFEMTPGPKAEPVA